MFRNLDDNNANELTEVIKSIASPLEERKCLEMKGFAESKVKMEIKSEVTAEQQNDQVKCESFDQKAGIKCEATIERPALLPVKAEAINHHTSVDGMVVAVPKTNRKRSFDPETELTSAKRVKRKASTQSSDIILTTYSLIWRDLSELQKKNFGMYRILSYFVFREMYGIRSTTDLFFTLIQFV